MNKCNLKVNCGIFLLYPVMLCQKNGSKLVKVRDVLNICYNINVMRVKQLSAVILILISFSGMGQNIVVDDVYNFWDAFDKVVHEKDSVRQVGLMKTLYIDKGTPGLDGIMRARRYTAEEYVYAINHYPRFWKSIRKNTLKARQFSNEIQMGIKQLKQIYPDLKPATIYFEIGILRTGGTTIDGMLLIGSEISMADKTTVTEEFDKRYPHLKSHFNTNPINEVVFLNVHEYIHTQQKETIGHTLLAQTLIEGAAEFLAELALNKPSPNPQIAFGYKNEEKIKAAYEKEMFSPNIYNWIWNSADNPFGMRDLGYFVGYAICKKYYDQAVDKKYAVKKIIELDYNNESSLMEFVNASNYFTQPIATYKVLFEKERPKVSGIKEFGNGNEGVNSGNQLFTLMFSEEMNPDFRNFELGPLGEEYLLRITNVHGFSEDNKSFTFEATTQPDQRYQILVNFGFRSKKGYPLVPYLIDFKTQK